LNSLPKAPLNLPEGEKLAPFLGRERKPQWQKCCSKCVPCLPFEEVGGAKSLQLRVQLRYSTGFPIIPYQPKADFGTISGGKSRKYFVWKKVFIINSPDQTGF